MSAPLEAGAILPGPPSAPDLDTVTARAYRHPVLDGRTVVRLVGATVGPAEDLSMEFLGFTPAAEPVVVGHARRQALGFPAWALVHDPANGRHALALVKEMEKLARLARQKPGNAKDGYDLLAERLGAAAPQFLPTFWEQAGRAFLAADNQRMAGTCFTAARRAEEVHALPIDEDRLRDVHLEFAFAGALTAAMLTAYARGVVDRRPPADAYALVKTLALRRVAGGLPPHTSMAADLARLAKAAGLDAEREADEVAGRLVTYPAMQRAHPSVWKSYRRVLVRLGKHDAAVRARLLEILPEPPGYDTDMTDQWLELLEASGAAASFNGNAGSWLQRFLSARPSGWRQRERRSERLLALVTRLLPALAAEGGVTLAHHPGAVDLDVLDLCVAAGVPVRLGREVHEPALDVHRWLRDEGPGRRDLAAVAADPVLRPLLARGVRAAVGQLRGDRTLQGAALPAATLREAFGAAGVREVLSELVATVTARAGDSTVADLDDDLTFLATLWSPEGMAFAPAGFRRLITVDVPAVLGRTLRGGLAAELGWPAYERVVGRINKISCGVAWPELVVHDERTAFVIRPDGEVSEHVFRFPPAGDRRAPARYSTTGCLYADGELLVAWRTEHGMAGYWSSRPDEVFESDRLEGVTRSTARHSSLPLPGGGVTTGGRPIHPGDPDGPGELGRVIRDGRAYWRMEADPRHGHYWQWREFDPRTGAEGRISRPAFFTDDTDAGASYLRPSPFAGSPLGSRDGLAGWRMHGSTGTGVDGRQVTVPGTPDRHPGLRREPVGALSIPGVAAPLPLTHANTYAVSGVAVWTADGRHLLGREIAPSSTLPPLDWWHALRPRDEKGSAALRGLTDRTAADLLETADTGGVAPARADVEAAIAAHLPAVTDPALLVRLTDVVAKAVELRRRLAEVPAHLAADVPAAAPPAVPDATLRLAWDGLCDGTRTYYHGSAGPRHDLLQQVRAVAARLTDIPAVTPVWTGLLGGLGAVALRAASPATDPEHRAALATFLDTVAGTPLSGDGPPMRAVELSQPRMATRQFDFHGSTVVFPPDDRYTYGRSHWTRTAVQIGSFDLPQGMTLESETRPSPRWPGDALRACTALLAARGPAPWRPEAADALAAATGLTRAEAVLLLAGLPGIATWEANFLTPAQRSVLGITAAQAKVAKAALITLSPRERVALLDAAMPSDPAALWESGPDVAAIAEVWISLRGRRIPVPEELVAALARVIDKSLAAGVLQAIAAPADGDWLSTDGRSELVGASLRTSADSGQPFDDRHLVAVAAALPWLGYHLRWDDPLRAALPPGAGAGAGTAGQPGLPHRPRRPAAPPATRPGSGPGRRLHGARLRLPPPGAGPAHRTGRPGAGLHRRGERVGAAPPALRLDRRGRRHPARRHR